MSTLRIPILLAAATLVATASLAGAVHFYRGPGGGCTPAEGELGEGPVAPAPGAKVLMLHNTFHDGVSGTPVTRVAVGEAVVWTWNSAHCHSVVAGAFYSGFHYPAREPGTPAALPGLLHYPVPETSASLSYTRTFAEPGEYRYACEHHGAIGMVGVVIVG